MRQDTPLLAVESKGQWEARDSSPQSHYSAGKPYAFRTTAIDSPQASTGKTQGPKNNPDSWI